MPEAPHKSEISKGMKRGIGWAFGVGTVVTVASVLRDGGRATIKSAMIASMQGQTRFAEVSEHMQDLYAEARHERLSQDSQSPTA